MIKSFFTQVPFFVCLLVICSVVQLNAQKTVFSENFNAPQAPQNSTYTTSGSIGTSRWNVSRSDTDFGAKIDGGMLTLTNDVGSSFNRSGWVLASTPTSNFLPGYNPVLSQNPGIVSWTFNMRQIRTNPDGPTNGDYGVAYVLAGTAGSTNSTGKGYAIMLGTPGLFPDDPIRLATYNNGVATYYTKLSSYTSGLSDFGREYTSIRVEYNPTNNEWSLYVRKDNSSSFNDPKTGTLVFQGKIANSEFVNEPLLMTGAYWSGGTGLFNQSNQTAFFDNISVDVVVPEISSILPDSKIANSGAFTLTVNGKGFTTASKIYWNGVIRPTTYVSATKLTAEIPATDITIPATVQITVRNGSYISNALPFQIEKAGVPVLTLSRTNLPTVATVQGTASPATETYTIEGINLTAAATVTAPANFEVSRDGTIYANPLTLGSTGGPLTDGTITLRARLKDSAPAGNYTGNITHTTTGAVTKSVAVSGRVLATEPTVNASSITFSNITSAGFRLNWTNGNGAQRLVLVRETSAVNGFPADATTYNANSIFSTGSEIGTGNYVVYKGTGSTAQVTGLKPNTAYHISVVEFNGDEGVENYRTSGAVNNTTTLNSPAGLQIKAADTSYKINFDTTVDGVNLDTFQGSGISRNAEPGQLDSESWAFTGFSGGAISFGGESPENSSYENGVSGGGEDETGIYAFNVGTTEDENHTLGVQPGGTDFNPGTITLRIQNQTGGPMTSLNIGYKVYVYNDQATSTKIEFSHGAAATGTYTIQSIVDVVSPTTGDLAPGWKAYYRVATITGLNIAKDNYYHVRWSGSLDSGTGAQDEFAIDDIEVIANPTSNLVAFGGVAEDFVLQGNANLSADLRVQNELKFNGGKLSIGDKALTIAGTVTNTTLQGLSGGSTSKLIVRGTKNPTLSFDQTTEGVTNLFQEFRVIGANPNTVLTANPFLVNDSLKVEEQQILNLGINALSGTLTIIQNDGIIRTQNTSATPFTSGKIWSGTGVLNLNAATAQQTLVAGTYTNLTLSSTGGTTAAADITVDGVLDLPSANASATKGSLDMATYTLVMGPDGINTGQGDVTGITRRNFFTTNKLYTFGHPNSSITFPPSGTLPSTMSAKLTIGAEPSWRTGTIKRNFDIIQTDGVNTKAIIRQHYLDSELNSNDESKLVFWTHTISPLTTFDQGRSNNNTAANWVEISNANIGLYFKNTFDQVYISLDETAGSDLVWNGSASTSWITAENWTPLGVPSAQTKVLIPAVSTTSDRSPIIDATSSVKSLTIAAGGIVNTPDSAQLTVFDGAGAWQNNGTFNPGTSTVLFNNLDATISGSTTFNNVTIPTGAGLRALDGNYMSIAGTLVNNGTMFTALTPNTIEFTGTQQTIPAPGGDAFAGYHHLTVSGAGATIAPSYTAINIRGNLTLNQSVSFVGKTVNLTGVSQQTIGGNGGTISFDNLIVNKETGNVILSQDIKVNGTLTLTSGSIALGDKNLTLGSAAVAGTFNVNNMIIADGNGEVRRPFSSTEPSYFFPIGELTSSPSYSPIEVNITAGTFSNASVGVNVVDAKHPHNSSSQNFISRYWRVKQVGITGAVATIEGHYNAAENLFPQESMAAGQLDGTFNNVDNPWKKVGTLAGTTLTANNVSLTPDQTSVFTGIKGGVFSVEVYGYGEFCKNSPNVELSAMIEGGDAPYTYTWSNGLPNSQTVQVPTSDEGEITYTLAVRDANGFVAVDNNSPVKILPQSVGGTISNATPEICAAELIKTDLQLTGSVGNILYWQVSTNPTFANEFTTNIANSTTTLSGAQIGPINATTYIRAVLQNGDCAVAFSDTVSIGISSPAVWNGTSWKDDIKPTLTKSAVFNGNYSASNESINACNCEVGSDATLTIGADATMTIKNDIINNGNIIVESDGNLIQLSDTGKYTGGATKFTVQRKANIKRLDYVYWSSPVADQQLKAFSPGTLDNRFLTYNEGSDLFTAVPNVDVPFEPGKGYAIRAKNNQPTTATDWTGNFIGRPNNGEVTFELQYKSGTDGRGNGYNLVGNPYPSNISFDNLFTTNEGKIAKIAYFWNNSVANVAQQGSAYDGANYAVYNQSGGTPASQSTIKPDGIVKVGQGFIVQSVAVGQSLTFVNEMRTGTTTNFFDRKELASKDRFWLQLTTPSHDFNTMLISYVLGATNSFELDYDAPMMSMSSDAFYSVLGDKKLNIQGKQYPLNILDMVSLGANHYVAGDHVISLQQAEGIFINHQPVYLKDKLTATITNLSEGSYTFAAQKGLSEDRFEIIYKPETVLATDNHTKEQVAVYREGNQFIVKAQQEEITGVQVFDTAGRLIYQMQPNSKTAMIPTETIASGVYIVKIDQRGKITSRKIIK